MASLSYVAGTPTAQLPDIFTHAEALAVGISDRVLYRMRDNGDIDRLARGIYARPGLQADPDLVEIAIRSPMATLCLTSALAHHALTVEIHPQTNVPPPRSQRSPRTEAPARWHRFDEGTFNVGRTTTLITDDLCIGIYSATRSIVDAYRLRHLYGTDQALEALKRWLRIKGNQPSTLLDMTKHFPSTKSVIRSTIETLL